MESTITKSLPQRLLIFFVTFGAALVFVYVFLPYLTRSFDILNSMSRYLDDNGIDPTRYYYTDVEQVQEAEEYLESVLEEE
ncbi:hypothetical protein [Desulfosediminicola flagellatus]|uniref:hypothetical protein n=1 Tax=Desulfosediminicola flagellatus TaxID=2569541 RepID=UPI0010ABA414|nr:hypothetical protein [Desulfosediminicola flagellatus]